MRGKASMEHAHGKNGNTISSVVIPFYNEAESLVMVCEEVREDCAAHGDLSWGLVMVDDGSTAKTSSLVDEPAQRYSSFRAVHINPGSGGVKGNLWQIGLATMLLILSILSRRLLSPWFPVTGRESRER